jgi:hypothetical protein
MTHPHFDGLLYTLLEHMTSGEAGFKGAITLFLGGQLVEGTPISEAEFLDRFEALGNQLYSQFPEITDDARQEYKDRQERFQRVGGSVKEVVKAAPEAEPLVQLPLTYVHLKDVRVLGVGAVEMIPLWRGRLSEVTGWNLGWDEIQGEEFGPYAT